MAVDYALSWGLEAIEARVTGLADRLRELLTDCPACTCTTMASAAAASSPSPSTASPPRRSSSSSHSRRQHQRVPVDYARFDLPGRGLPDVVRASVHYYNTDDELDQLINALPNAQP